MLNEALAGTDLPVLLHYAGYGYQARGCPTRLVAGLRDWKRRGGGRLVTVFHEVYASGPPWRSSFWLFPFQRRLAAERARRSDGIVTSLEIYRSLLHRLVPGREAEVLRSSRQWASPRRYPLWKSAATPRGLGVPAPVLGLRAAVSHLAAACRTLEIEEICVSGRGDDCRGPAVPVRRLARWQPATSASSSSSLAGFATYRHFSREVDGLAAMRPRSAASARPSPPGGEGCRGLLLAGRRCAGGCGTLQEMATRARAWYAGTNRSYADRSRTCYAMSC